MAAEHVTGKPRAIDTAGIGAKFARSRRRAIALTVIGVIALIGSAVMWRALDRMYLARQNDLVAMIGRIDDFRGHDDSPDQVVVSFTWAGKPKTATVQVGKHHGYYDGQTVTVLSSLDGAFVTLPGENYFPQGIELLCFVVVGTSIGLLIGGGIWWVRSQRKLTRSGASSWRTVTAYFAQSRGENDEKTVFYLPDYTPDRFWKTSGRVPLAPARIEVAGSPDGIVLRSEEDAKLVLAKPEKVRAPKTARVLASAENDRDVAFRLAFGVVESVYEGRARDLPPDVGDFAAVRAATVWEGRSGLALVQLGRSTRPSPFRRVSGGKARKEWPQLADGW